MKLRLLPLVLIGFSVTSFASERDASVIKADEIVKLERLASQDVGVYKNLAGLISVEHSPNLTIGKRRYPIPTNRFNLVIGAWTFAVDAHGFEGMTVAMVPIDEIPSAKTLAAIDFTADCRFCAYRSTFLKRNESYLSGDYFPKNRADSLKVINLASRPDPDTRAWYQDFREEVLELLTVYFERGDTGTVKTPILDAMLQNIRNNHLAN